MDLMDEYKVNKVDSSAHPFMSISRITGEIDVHFFNVEQANQYLH